MEKIAIISDIHSNLEALKAVMADIKKNHITKIFCIGDIIAKGVHAKECIDIVKNNCEIIIQGNCDHAFCQKSNFIPDDDEDVKRFTWNQQLLGKEEIEFLKNLPFSFEFYMSGSYIRLFHTSPNSVYGFKSMYDTLEEKLSMFKGTDNTMTYKTADIVIYGHNHTQFMEQLAYKTLINVGSVGNELVYFRDENIDYHIKEVTNAFYFVIEGEYGSKNYSDSLSFSFKRVPYSIEKELDSPILNIERESYEKELKEGIYRNQKRVNQYIEKVTKK